jgi:hypothetical protein
LPTFEQTSFAFPDQERSERERAIDTASKATKIRQEIRRQKQEAPRLSSRPISPLEDEEARQRLERRVASHLPATGRLALAITDNRYTIISVKRDRGLYRARIHHMFLEAPPNVTRSLARYIALNEADASRELGTFIEEHQTTIRRTGRRAPALTLETAGEIWDLQEVYDTLNGRYFAGKIDARITWGTRGGRRRRRTSIKMGSYSVEEKLIRIHPSLDRRFVPRYFLEWIVFHEMLHQVHDIPVVDGRRQFHTPAFLADERSFEHYEIARDWEQRNLDRILHF